MTERRVARKKVHLGLRDKIRKRIEQKRLEQQMGGNYLKMNGVPLELYKPAAGTSMFDIIPYKVKNNPLADVNPGEYWFERTFYIHSNIGTNPKSYLCPKSFGKPCPICDYRTKLMKRAKSDADWELVKALKPRERQLFLIFDLKDKKYKVFESSYYLFGKKLEEEVNEGDEEWADFAEIDNGFTLRVRFSERKAGGFSFLEAARIDFIPRKHQVKMLKISLDDLLNLLPEEKLEQIFFEGVPDFDEDGGDLYAEPEMEEDEPVTGDEEAESEDVPFDEDTPEVGNPDEENELDDPENFELDDDDF